MIRSAALLLALIVTPAVAAPTLSLPPSASRTVDEARTRGSYELPVGPWADGGIEALPIQGEISRTAWRITDNRDPTLTILDGLRDQLKSEGFEVIFECDTDACGGFDFRFATDVLPEPQMHVDLGDFRVLSARRGTDGSADYVCLIVSRTSDSAYVQMTRVGEALNTPLPIAAAKYEPEVAAPTEGALDDQLVAVGKVVLGDLDFASGTTILGPGPFASLADLAAWLKANPDKTIALVGHSDATGALAANITLSRARAQSVLDRLATEYGIPRKQMAADGVGFLSPLASNLTEDGRTRNRRVEALITSTQ
ncbi:MAG TPA: OmpA family protein [Albidovulum sp.]|uniref:OmpA family protein n=1 Tax=Albidovulum sp. TaxID=1872424 RepID=UPI002CDF4771|nr:OmpA family protein [Albidovulum sp.]